MTHALRQTPPSIRDMIDRYIAAGLHQRVPANDARLKPTPRRLDWDSLTPHATAATVYRAARTTKDRAPVAHESWPPMTATVATLGGCPSTPGSSRAQRFEILAVGLTLQALRARGLRLSDLTRYLQTGAVTLDYPTAEPAHSSGLEANSQQDGRLEVNGSKVISQEVPAQDATHPEQQQPDDDLPI